ncbi:MAG TPA: YHS domain-containing protein [Candidatus Brocadiales bacterium]|nr:YHS domain-containing protein [Candidatus Brocadiales bacterium]
MKRFLYLTSIIAFFAALTIGYGYNNGTLFACGMGGSGCSAKPALSEANAMEHSQAQVAEGKEKVTDPVCAMEVDKDPAKSIQHEGYTYYFCSKNCIEKFQKDTKKYACPCADIKPGCNCYHCTGRGGGCDCLEKQKKEGGEHPH